MASCAPIANRRPRPINNRPQIDNLPHTQVFITIYEPLAHRRLVAKLRLGGTLKIGEPRHSFIEALSRAVKQLRTALARGIGGKGWRGSIRRPQSIREYWRTFMSTRQKLWALITTVKLVAPAGTLGLALWLLDRWVAG